MNRVHGGRDQRDREPVGLDDLHDVETRVTDASTGGQKGSKLTQIGALDPVAQIEVARVAGMGAEKYAPFNYLKGTKWSLMYNAMHRHAMLFWAGEDTDTESGLSHMAHVSWMAQALVSFAKRGLGTDDRPPAMSDPQPALDFSRLFPDQSAPVDEREAPDWQKKANHSDWHDEPTNVRP